MMVLLWLILAVVILFSVTAVVAIAIALTEPPISASECTDRDDTQ
jgi:hypothetical protein